MKRLEDKVAFITGGGSGIARAASRMITGATIPAEGGRSAYW